MPFQNAVESLTRAYPHLNGDAWAQTEIVSHRGTPIAVGQTISGRFYYAVLVLEADAAEGASDANACSANPLLLPFPVESLAAGAEAVSLQTLPVLTKDGTAPRPGSFVRPADRHPYRSTTASLSEPGAPFNLVSDGNYLCLFRPSRPDKALDGRTTILMDRYNFDGKTLSLKLETRYQRSRLKSIPLNQKDTLGFEDLDKNPFHEPTHRLHHVVDPVLGKHFAVLLVPSLVPDEQNWQFFNWDPSTRRIQCTSLPRGKDGLFDTQARTYFVSADRAQYPDVFSTHPGTDPGGSALVPWNGHGGKQRFSFQLPDADPACNGLHAAVYARQRTADVGKGTGYSPVAKPQLGEQRLLLAVGCGATPDAGDKPCFLVLDFGISRDGRMVHAGRERLIELEQADPQQSYEMPNCDAAMDALVLSAPLLGNSDENEFSQAGADRINDLQARRARNEKSIRDLLEGQTASQTQLVAEQSRVTEAEARVTTIQSDYETRFQPGRAHGVALFTDANPARDRKGNLSLGYEFPAFARLFNDQGDGVLPAPRTYRLADPEFKYNDAASAARVDSDVLLVEFYADFGAGSSGPSGWFETLDKRGTIDRFDPKFNDALTAVRIMPNDQLRLLLENYKKAKTDVNLARTALEQLQARQRQGQIELATLTAEKKALEKQIVDEQSKANRVAGLPMKVLANYDLQQSNIAGGFTAFAWSDHPPRLYNSADGRVSMYFRGAEDQYFVASLDTTENDNDQTATAAWRTGRSGNALALADAALTVSGNELAVTSQDRLTIEAWFRPVGRGQGILLSHRDYMIRLDSAPEPDAGFSLIYNIHNKQGHLTPVVPPDNWTHAAFVYRRAKGLRFEGKEQVNCGREKTLDVARDLTIEICLTPKEANGKTQTLLHKGDDGAAGPVAYALVLDSQLKLHWQYGAAAAGGLPRTVSLDTGIQLAAGKPTRIAIVREFLVDQSKLNGELEKLKQNPSYEMNMSFSGFVHRFYQEGELKKAEPSTNVTLTGGDGAFFMGADASQEAGFQGVLADVRVWNRALAIAELHQAIPKAGSGLVSWWPLDAGDGYSAEDMKSSNHGAIVGAQWSDDPDERASTVVAYINGQRVTAEQPGELKRLKLRPEKNLTIGGTAGNEDVFTGELEEIRLWSCARSQAQIRDNLFRGLDDDRDGLLAYIDGEVEAEVPGGLKLTDPASHGLSIVASPTQLDRSTAPIGADAPVLRAAREGIKTLFSRSIQSTASATEYGALEADGEGNGMGVLKRVYAYIDKDGWNLLTGFKVGDLSLEWIGQAQFEPQVVGFIEGAPPVPSENLTAQELDNYDGAASVKINEAQSMMYAIGTSSELTSRTAFELTTGVAVDSESEVGLGAATSVQKTEIAGVARVSHESTSSTGSETQMGLGGQQTHTSTMSLTGYWESGTGQYPAIGQRYVPQNVGCAVVQSETVDMFALRMKSTGVMVSRSIRKNPDIPRDWNIIMFPINPRYTKQGTLDGKVGLNADVDYPAGLSESTDSSYFKPLEAYRWKRAVEQQAQLEREKYVQFSKEPLGGLPRLHQRSIANTYVWTADGGLFAESAETIDSIEETSTGSLSWDTSVGVSADFKVIMGTVGPVGSFEFMSGGGVTTTTLATASSETGFSLEVELEVESDIYARDTGQKVMLDLRGQPKKSAGKVDAYRFMSFYLAPENTHLQELKNRVVDPTWLGSDDPNARALKSALGSIEARPWRIMHRVTFVSRVYDAPGTASTSTLSDDQLTLDETTLSSNYELILALRPHIVGCLHDYTEFKKKVKAAVPIALPAYADKVDDIVNLAGAYFGMFPGRSLGT